MNDVVLSGLTALLVGAVGVLSYVLGRKVEKNAEFAEKEAAEAETTANATAIASVFFILIF